MPDLNWRHHLLIQALLSRGPLREKEFHGIFTGVTGKSPDTHRQLFNDYLLKINKALSCAQFELRGCRDQYDGLICYGIVNTISDEQSKMGTKYSVPQIAFYKAIVEAIVQDASAQGGISNINALHLQLESQAVTGSRSQSQGSSSSIPPPIRNFSISQKEKTLHDLVQDQWLSCTNDGFVKLGVRSFLDLRSWFRNNDAPSCEVCNEAGVKAELCSNETCTTRIHHYCLEKMSSKKRGARTCPSCSTPWKHTGPKAEATNEEDEPDLQAQTQPPSGSKRKRLKTEIDTSGGIASGSVTASQSSASLRRTTRSSARAMALS